MKIPINLRTKLVSEIGFVIEKIKTEKELRKRIYYFSAVHGEMLRILNIIFDRQLLFMHNVLNYSYQAMKMRADVIVMGRDTLIAFPEGFFDRLCVYLEDLAKCIKNNKDPYLILEDISCLAYITTGNGYYLYQKGILKL